MNASKKEIINLLFQQEATDLTKKFTAYRQQYPYDVDMYLLEGYWQLLHNNLAEAEKLLLQSQKHNPCDVDTYFLLGEYYLQREEYPTAIACYSYANSLNDYLQQNYLFYHDTLLLERLRNAQELFQNKILEADSQEQIEIYQEQFSTLQKNLHNSFDLYGYLLISSVDQIGKTLFFTAEGERFCAYADTMHSNHFEYLKPKSLMFLKGELLKIKLEGTSFSTSSEETILLPVASRETGNRITISSSDSTPLTILQKEKNHFNYYRINGAAQITSEHAMIIGEPVRLGHEPSRKKIVINLFVDGLSQKVLKEENLEKVMPNTYRFFSKGLICENFFTTSDWTYPSLASFVSGTTLANHMMFHPTIHRALPTDQKVLFDYFKEAGYYTAMINCDPQSTSTLGYTRAIDRYIAQHGVQLKAGAVINEALEHLEAFRETDQLLWLTYADLHDIADGCELPVSLQTQIGYTLRQEEEPPVNSVKQKHSPQKRAAYIQALHRADLHFQSLYNYLEQNYAEDEYVIILFGDHGQTYLLPPEEHHLARYHSNVGFMTRGGGYSGICREYMSAIDYPHILCKLADIPETPQTPEGQLPKVFGGKTERRFTITETIHPNDYYEASFHAKDHIFYLTSKDKVTNYGRLDAGEFETRLVDHNGYTLNNPKLTEYYTQLTRQRLRYILAY